MLAALLGSGGRQAFLGSALARRFSATSRVGLGLGRVAEQGFELYGEKVAGVDAGNWNFRSNGISASAGMTWKVAGMYVCPIAYFVEALAIPTHLHAKTDDYPINELTQAILLVGGNHKVFLIALSIRALSQ